MSEAGHAPDGTVNSRITDSVASVVTLMTGQSPAQAFAMLDTVMAETLGMAMHNAVIRQQSASMVNSAAVTAACAKMLQTPFPIAPPPPPPVPPVPPGIQPLPVGPLSPAEKIAVSAAAADQAIETLKAQAAGAASNAAQAQKDLAELAALAQGVAPTPPTPPAPPSTGGETTNP